MEAMPNEPLRTDAQPSPPNPAWRTFGVVLTVLALGFMLWRGPMRALAPGGSSDFSLIWQSTRAWAEGQSPYTVESTAKVWREHAGAPAGEEPPSERNAALLVYPPTTFVVMAPWCLTDWTRSAVLWAAANTVLLMASVVLTLGLAGLTPRRAAWWFGAAGMLLLAPGHTAISVGQVSVLVYFLIVLAQAMRLAGRENACGGLLGLACAIKPQVALLFLAYEVGRRRWRVGIAGAVTVAAVGALGVWWLSRAGIDWVGPWRANLAAFAGSDNANPTAANPLRYHLINLHYLLHGFIGDVGTVKLLVYAVCGGLAAGYFVADLKKPEGRGELTSASFVAVIAMLVVYHRMYDAVVLLLPAAWLVRELAAGRRGVLQAGAGLGLAAFLAPGASLLNSLAVSGRLPRAVAEAGWFQAVVMPHAPLALLVLAGVLAAARARDPREPGPQRLG